MSKRTYIGKTALKLVLADEESELSTLQGRVRESGLRSVTGKVGSMDIQHIFGAIELAAGREGIVDKSIKERHALYHAVYECCSGVMRGNMVLGGTLRTLGARFAVVRGHSGEEGTDWIAVAIYGTIGATSKGVEHEAAGLGISHI